MAKNHVDLNFKPATIKEWSKVASEELGEANPVEKLSFSKGSLTLKPYYDSSLTTDLDDFRQLPSLNPHYGARSWMNTPRIRVTDEKTANNLALAALQSGADGILFEPAKANLQFDILLNKIKPEFCTISFFIWDEFSKTAFSFKEWAAKNDSYNTLTGCFFWKTFPEKEIDLLLNSGSETFLSLGLMVLQQENAEDEIATALEQATNLVDQLTNEGIDVKHVLDKIAFSLNLSTDLFLEIAKLKSLQNLWYQIQGAYGIKQIKPVHIHATSSAWINEKFQPHGNMIKSTTAAIASIIGGCCSLTIEPEDDTNEMMKRIALNVSSVLREESYLSKVADPTAGSYYLDSLITELSEKAWSKFQSKMKS